MEKVAGDPTQLFRRGFPFIFYREPFPSRFYVFPTSLSQPKPSNPRSQIWISRHLAVPRIQGPLQPSLSHRVSMVEIYLELFSCRESLVMSRDMPKPSFPTRNLGGDNLSQTTLLQTVKPPISNLDISPFSRPKNPGAPPDLSVSPS